MRSFSRKLILTRDTWEEGKAKSCTGQRVFYNNNVAKMGDKDELEKETFFLKQSYYSVH